MTDPIAALSDEKYISLTTYKRDGGAVDVPVWVANSDGQLLFTTPAGSFKVKRLSRNDAVKVRPCDMRGRVADAAPQWTGTGEIVTDAAKVEAAHGTVRSKYGVQHWFARNSERVRRLVKRDSAGDAAIYLHLSES